MHTYEICPPLLTHPGWYLLTHTCTCTGSHTNRESSIHCSGGQPFTAPGEHGGTVSCSRAPQPWQGGELPPLQLSVHQSFERWDWGLNRLQVIGWPTLTTEPRPPLVNEWFRKYGTPESRPEPHSESLGCSGEVFTQLSDSPIINPRSCLLEQCHSKCGLWSKLQVVQCINRAESAVYLSPAEFPASGNLSAALHCIKEESKSGHSTSCSPLQTRHDTYCPQLCLPTEHIQRKKM